MKTLLTYILIILSTTLVGQTYTDWKTGKLERMNSFDYIDTVFIDKDNYGDPSEDGSIEHPFDSWADLFPTIIVRDTVYRDTIIVIDSTIKVYFKNITL